MLRLNLQSHYCCSEERRCDWQNNLTEVRIQAEIVRPFFLGVPCTKMWPDTRESLVWTHYNVASPKFIVKHWRSVLHGFSLLFLLADKSPSPYCATVWHNVMTSPMWLDAGRLSLVILMCLMQRNREIHRCCRIILPLWLLRNFPKIQKLVQWKGFLFFPPIIWITVCIMCIYYNSIKKEYFNLFFKNFFNLSGKSPDAEIFSERSFISPFIFTWHHYIKF